MWEQSGGDLDRYLDAVDRAYPGFDASNAAAVHKFKIVLQREKFFWTWAQGACTTLITGHKYAAALMCTDPGEVGFELRMPWPAVKLRVPDGLLRASIDGREYHYRWVYVLEHCKTMPAFVCVSEHQLSTSVLQMMTFQAPTISDVLWPPPERVWAACTEDDEVDAVVKNADLKERLRILTFRFVIGMLGAVTYTNNFTSKIHGRKSKTSREQGEPEHRVIVVGEPIDVDCRPQVRDWLTSSEQRTDTPPVFQKLIKGHMKRQVIGIGRTGRKVIWIKPYWRGPKNAPILVRPYRVGEGE